RDRASILALPLHFESIHPPVTPEFLSQPLVLQGILKDILLRIEQQHIFGRRVPEHRNKRWIDIEESSIKTRAINSVDRALYQRAVTRLGTAERQLVSLDLDGAGQLPGDKGENLFVPASVADVPGVRLHHECPERMIADFQRNPHPVER